MERTVTESPGVSGSGLASQSKIPRLPVDAVTIRIAPGLVA
jgi:hypothetical protein